MHRHLKVALAVLALAANLSHPSLARADNQSEIAKGDGDATEQQHVLTAAKNSTVILQNPRVMPLLPGTTRPSDR